MRDEDPPAKMWPPLRSCSWRFPTTQAVTGAGNLMRYGCRVRLGCHTVIRPLREKFGTLPVRKNDMRVGIED